ncbi:MAG: hypothetical protein UY76_C0055G0006 [Candidatus Uhrbacteria bacterium GW2011_GWA2_52_8d]|uniref:Uncharacterized protein n=1 Tax=Candidatus Uhrbacteria bacterium GW2011_GWA2_52_8d TaxID=1618979 RepID=A0A0G1XK00_9BACT|nr:MAG: hypothetical protein UY76_C0055G0006 [Candidatus Uhrbacteria bacterium GW2011_GWA2_52_8d]
MSPFIRIPLGLAIMVVGFLMVKKTDVVLTWFGQVPFAEQKFGPGGSRFFYKLLGILITFIGIFVATNVISGILQDLAGLLTHTTDPNS